MCALLPAVTFPAFLQLACVLLGELLHSLTCGHPFLPAYERRVRLQQRPGAWKCAAGRLLRRCSRFGRASASRPSGTCGAPRAVARLTRRAAAHGRQGGQPLLHDCPGAIQRDFLRVSSLIDCDMGVPPDWLRGRSPTMTLAQFQARWCPREVLCRAESDRVLELRWTAAHPVPLPTEGIG